MIRDIIINKNNIDAFSALIPEEYHEELNEGTLTGFGYYEEPTPSKKAEVVGTIIVRRFGRWLEIEWIGVADNFDLPCYTEEIFDTLSYRLSTSPVNYVGCYMKVYPQEKDMQKILSDGGFKFGKGKDGVYEFTVDMVDRSRLSKAEQYLDNCRSIKEADGNLLANVERKLREDARPLPISFPIKYDDYDQDMSMVYNDDDFSGIILSTVHEGYVILEAMVSQGVYSAAALLEYMLISFETLFDKKMVISVPVVSDEADNLMRKLVPEAQQREIQVGYLYL